MITGEVRGHTWLRRPELQPFEVKQHKTIPGLTFELGKEPTGKVDVRTVEYPRDWPQDKVLSAAENRERLIQTEGCPHCNAYNLKMKLSEQAQETPAQKEARLRVLPGKRPVRDLILKVWDKT